MKNIIKSMFAIGLCSVLSLNTAMAQSVLSQNVPERSIGKSNAPQVDEWFSLTCIHCAKFDKDVFPLIKKNLIDTGKIRYVFHDFPMDNLGLIAAAVSRKLPETSYLPFIESLLSSQDYWAFGADPKNIYSKLKSEAALAGMNSQEFDTIVNDKEYLKTIIKESVDAHTEYHLNSTPSFKFPDGTIKSGEMSYDDFIKALKISP